MPLLKPPVPEVVNKVEEKDMDKDKECKEDKGNTEKEVVVDRDD